MRALLLGQFKCHFLLQHATAPAASITEVLTPKPTSRSVYLSSGYQALYSVHYCLYWVPCCPLVSWLYLRQMQENIVLTYFVTAEHDCASIASFDARKMVENTFRHPVKGLSCLNFQVPKCTLHIYRGFKHRLGRDHCGNSARTLLIISQDRRKAIATYRSHSRVPQHYNDNE